MLRAAIRDPDPVSNFEHKALYGKKARSLAHEKTPALGSVSVVKPGTDLTIVASQLMLHYAFEAAGSLTPKASPPKSSIRECCGHST